MNSLEIVVLTVLLREFIGYVFFLNCEYLEMLRHVQTCPHKPGKVRQLVRSHLTEVRAQYCLPLHIYQ